MLTFQRLEHQQPFTAARLLQALALAHAQESAAIDSEQPHQRTVEDIQSSEAIYFGAFEGLELLGVIAVGPDDEGEQLAITLLFVRPEYQRRGIAKKLLGYVLTSSADIGYTVTVAKMNTVAIGLYKSMGFTVYRYGAIGANAVQVIKLRKNAP